MQKTERNVPFCRTYQIGGLMVDVSADLPITNDTFAAYIEQFRIGGSKEESISIHHHFSLPDLRDQNLGQRVFHQLPWAIYHREQTWTYLGITPWTDESSPYMVALFDEGHTYGEIHHANESRFRAGNAHSLTFFPTDQVLLARVLADHQACYLHAAGMILDGQGVAFIGHSEAGKSTTVTMLQEEGEILCDDRIIVRHWPDGFRVHGSWSHGDVPVVSPDSAPLRALFFLEQSKDNRAVRLDRQDVVRRLPPYVVRPLLTADWWIKILDLVGTIARQVPVYRLELDKSGAVKDVLRRVLHGELNEAG
jgi:hypothetical protein